MDRGKLGGVLATCSGAVLIVALLLTWWDYPSAFEHPADLPKAAQSTAEVIAANGGQTVQPNAFDFFAIRDVVFLATGLIGFGFGLCLLVFDRLATAAKMAVGVVCLVALGLLIATLLSPPDYAEVGPAGGKPFDFGVSLPLHPEVGLFVALGSVVGLLAGVGLSIAEPGRPAESSRNHQ